MAHDTKDISKQVLLTPQIVDVWWSQAQAHVEKAMQTHPHLRTEDIPDEEIEWLGGDELRVHVTLPDGTVLAEMLILKEHWCWMQG